MSERVLPEGWVLASIDQVSIKGEQRKPDAAEQFIYVDIGSIDRESKVIASPQRLSGSDAPSRARKVISVGDVLVSLTRPNLNAVALVGKEYDGQIVSTGFEVIRPVGVDSRFVFFLVRGQAFIDAISGRVQGALYPAAKSSDVKGYQFPLPPSEEQKAIADKLDKLLAQVNNLKARLDAIPAILKRFRQSVLAAAVSGQLYSFDNANGWQDVCIGDLAALVTSGSRGWSKYYSGSGDLFVRAQNIKNDVLDLDDVAYVDLPERAEGARTKIKEGDFLITITGANVTKCALVGMDVGVAYVSQHVGLVRWSERRYGPYLELFLKSEIHGRKQLLDMAYGGGKPGLNLQNIRDVSLRLPSIEEQAEIVRRVDQLFAFADQVEQQVANAQARVDKLTQSILAKAFRGELTAEWRAENPELISGDNSAATLLERIKAEKAKQKPAKTRRGGRKATVTS